MFVDIGWYGTNFDELVSVWMLFVENTFCTTIKTLTFKVKASFTQSFGCRFYSGRRCTFCWTCLVPQFCATTEVNESRYFFLFMMSWELWLIFYHPFTQHTKGVQNTMLVRTLKPKILIKHEIQTDHFPQVLHLYPSQLNEP